MKRALIGAGLIVALAFPATIIANIRHFEGTVDEGGTVRFVTKVRHGKTIKVRQFVFKHVPMQCDDGASTVGDVGTPPPAMRVNSKHRFHGNFTSSGGRQAAAHRWQAQGSWPQGPGHPARQGRLRRWRDQLRHGQGPLERQARRLEHLSAADFLMR